MALKKLNKKEKGERGEALMRIVVGIISGILLYVWLYLVCILVIIHLFIVIFSGKRNKGVADFCEYWNTESYKYFRYMTFVSDVRPFPFTDIERMSKFE
ncbi:MAG: DUF4389 domain-containing protein [Candidatus Pacearchaeota archaeon]